jgi:CheY-like chemotaxis protein
MIARFRRYEADMLQFGQRTHRQLVIAVTANGEQGGNLGEQGFDEMLPKPLNKNDIYHVVNKYLNSSGTFGAAASADGGP